MLGLGVIQRQEHSKSFPNKKIMKEDSLSSSFEARHHHDMGHLKDYVRTKKKQCPKVEPRVSLNQEILQLERRLQEQFEVRCALEKALNYKSLSLESTNEISLAKPATELIKEIAVLELEVVYLEQYILSLYRKAFHQRITSVSPPTKDEINSSVTTPRGMCVEEPKRENLAVQSDCHSLDNPWKQSNVARGEQTLLDSNVHRCHSSLSQHSAFFTKTSPLAEPLDRAFRACHSQPLSMMEYAQNTSDVVSLAEHLGTRISDHVPQTPNRLSEDMIKCISEIYCKLSDSPLLHNNLSSPNSPFSSTSAFSPQDPCDTWSPGFRNNSSFHLRLENPFHVEGLKEFSGPYSTMIEVPSIHRENQQLVHVEHLVQNFRSLASCLEVIDPRKLNHEEKLAFWINVHNALVMHAFLAYGIPQNNMKRVFLLLKAAYNVGGYTVSADTIQNSILGCRISRPGQWLRLLLSSRMKFTTRDERQSYAIKHREPLLHFALSSGSHSDPAVRVYTPKRIYQELEGAKEEYIRATFGVSKDRKILLPKMIESFMKDSGMCQTGVVEMIQKSFPESIKKSVRKSLLGNTRKRIEWIPHNFSFRYLIYKELVK